MNNFEAKLEHFENAIKNIKEQIREEEDDYDKGFNSGIYRALCLLLPWEEEWEKK